MSRDTAVRADELRALVVGERATASLSFSAHARPEGFFVRLYGTRAQAGADLYEPGVAIRRGDLRVGPFLPTVAGLAESKATAVTAVRSLTSRLAGRPASHSGLEHIVTGTYAALREGRAVLVAALTSGVGPR
jgi:hypothetical protein